MYKMKKPISKNFYQNMAVEVKIFDLWDVNLSMGVESKIISVSELQIKSRLLYENHYLGPILSLKFKG